MNATVREWIAKAEADFRTAERESSVTDGPNYDAVCFHAQQCIEKLLKGLLIHRRVVPPKTYDLIELDRLLRPVCPQWSWATQDLRMLTRAAAEARYPGESADLETATAVFSACKGIRARLLPLFQP